MNIYQPKGRGNVHVMKCLCVVLNLNILCISFGNARHNTPCQPGKYKDVSVQTTCKNCPSGRFSLAGAFSCYETCSTTDGSAPNIQSECLCGTKLCTSGSGMFCDIQNSRCFGPVCQISDGSANNNAPCSCGTADVADCKSNTDTGTGLICFNQDGHGSCRRSDFGAFGYSLLKTGSCPSANRFDVYNKVMCEKMAYSLKLSDVSATIPVQNSELFAPGCSMKTNTLYYNEKASQTPCSETNPCVCFSAPDCEYTDRSTLNTKPCACGTEVCLERNMYCIKSENRCDQNQKIGFRKVFAEKCEVPNIITTPETCQDAANALKILDTVKNDHEDGSEDYPKGCYYSSAERLNINLRLTNLGSCNSEINCLCKFTEKICSETDGTNTNLNSCICGSIIIPAGTVCNAVTNSWNCPARHSKNRKTSICELCQIGTYNQMSGNDCKLCPAGYFGPKIGESNCEACKVGMFSPGTGQTSISSCKECLKGFFNDQDGKQNCLLCLPGTFSNSNKQSKCTNCLAGSYTYDSGQTDCVDLIKSVKAPRNVTIATVVQSDKKLNTEMLLNFIIDTTNLTNLNEISHVSVRLYSTFSKHMAFMLAESSELSTIEADGRNIEGAEVLSQDEQILCLKYSANNSLIIEKCAGTSTAQVELSGGKNANAKNLKACIGECDNDGQCALGLKCFQRTNGEHIPGCKGLSAGNYCFNPNYICKDLQFVNANDLLFKNKHPASEVATDMGCTDGNGKSEETCLSACRQDPTCNYVWIYSSTGRCCFKKSYDSTASLTPNNGYYYKINRGGITSPWQSQRYQSLTCASLSSRYCSSSSFYNFYNGVKVTFSQACCQCGGGDHKQEQINPTTSKIVAVPLSQNRIWNISTLISSSYSFIGLLKFHADIRVCIGGSQHQMCGEKTTTTSQLVYRNLGQIAIPIPEVSEPSDFIFKVQAQEPFLGAAIPISFIPSTILAHRTTDPEDSIEIRTISVVSLSHLFNVLANPFNHAFQFRLNYTSGLTQLSGWTSPKQTQTTAAKPGAVQNLHEVSEKISFRDITFAWSPPEWVGTYVENYLVRIIVAPECGQPVFNNVEAKTIDGNTTELKIMKIACDDSNVQCDGEAVGSNVDLSPGTNYAIQVRAKNEKGKMNSNRKNKKLSFVKISTTMQFTTRFISLNGTDNDNCGISNTSTCRHLRYAMSQFTIKGYKFTLSGETHLMNESIVFGEEKMALIGAGVEYTKLDCSASVCIRCIDNAPALISGIHLINHEFRPNRVGFDVLGTTQDFVIENCWFSGFSQSAIRIVTTSGVGMLRNVVLRNNTAIENGGALSIESAFSVIIKSSKFENNHAPDYGGAVYISSIYSTSQVVLTSVSFLENEASLGGATYVSRFSDLSLNNVGMKKNRAKQGSAIFTQSATVYANDLVIKESESSNGDLVHCLGTLLSFKRSKFANNNVGTGIVVGTFCELSIDDSVFSHNKGTAIRLASSSTLSIQSTTFEFNNAQTGMDGGAVHCSGCTTVRISEESKFVNNTSNRGGALSFVNSPDVIISDVELTANIATLGGGGGMYYTGKVAPVFFNTIWNKNHALYGKKHASEPKAINVSVPIEIRNTEILQAKVQLIDYYGSIVDDRKTTMTVRSSMHATSIQNNDNRKFTSDTNIVLLGTTESIYKDAISIFDDLILSAHPSNVTLKFQLDLPGSTIETSILIKVLPCKSGQYLSLEGSPLCADCIAGKASNNWVPGKLCLNCLAGTIAPRSGQKSCISCNMGTYSTNGMSCLKCQVGKFSKVKASSKCNFCSPGKTTRNGSSVCVSCLKSTFDAGSRVCNACPDGTYQNEAGKTSCKTTLPPKASVIRRISSTRINVTFETTTLLPQRYDVQWSKTSDFEEINVDHHVILPTLNDSVRTVVLDVADPIEVTAVYVRTSIAGANVWSAPSKGWTLATDCGAFQYLDDRWPPKEEAELLDPPQPSFYDPKPAAWRCLPCPQGASCRHINATWDRVIALWGWWRITPKEFGRSEFAQCLYTPGCLGAANPEMSGRFLNETSQEDPALIEGQKEECAMGMGHRRNCSGGERCRLCNTCLIGYEKIRNGVCSKCPVEKTSNRGMLAGGFVAVAMAASVLVWIQIDNQGRGGLSDALKKVLINYLQVVSLAAGFPLEWPESMQKLFAIQSTMSTAGQYMLRPDCELSRLDAADAFYQKMLMYALFPPLVLSISVAFWGTFAYARTKHCAYQRCYFPFCCSECKHRRCDTREWCKHGPISWRKRTDSSYSPKDKMVLTMVVLLYMVYPTLLTESFSMLACKDVGGNRYLIADMQEKCFEGRHLNWIIFLCLPQVIFYSIGLPVVAIIFLRRNKSQLWSNRVVMFRYGLLYNGYNSKRYYWEGMMAIRKASMVALRVFGSLSGVQIQAHIGSALIVCFLITHLAAAPYDDIRHPGHRVLHNMDSMALVICWLTLWGGLFYYSDNLWTLFKTLLTMVLLTVNVVFFCWASFRLVQELARERDMVGTMKDLVHKFQESDVVRRSREFRRGSIFEVGIHRSTLKSKSKRTSLFDRMFATRTNKKDSIVVSNPLNAERKQFERKLTKKSSKSELMSLSKELRKAKHRAQEEVKELQRYELEVEGMVDQAPDTTGDDIGVETKNVTDTENTEIEIEMVYRTSRSRLDRLNQMRSKEDDEGNNPLFFNRAPPAPTRGEGEIKLDGEGEIKLDRPSPLPSFWKKKKKVSKKKKILRTKM